MKDNDRLEKIDIIRERTGLGYEAAAQLLDDAKGDVVEALVNHERVKKADHEEWEVKGNELVERVKKLLHEGNVRRIKVKKDDRVLLEIPVTAGVIGAVVAPELAVLGAAACVFGHCTVEVERGDNGSES